MQQAIEIKDLSKLCIHTETNRPWNLRECVEHYHSEGIRGISVWRHLLNETPPAEARKILDDHRMKVVSLVRGGFFASVNESDRKAAVEDNLLAISQADAIGAPLVVLVCGADPGQPAPRSLEQIREGIIRVLPEAEKAGIRLAVEPLHPMYAAGRSAIVTMRQANRVIEEINSEYLGVAVDVFHVWWDPSLREEIMRCGRMGKLFAFHICDWKVDMNDILNDRGLMGEGCIGLKEIRGWMEDAGFEGFREVEIFSDKYWARDQGSYLKEIINAYLNHV